MAFPIPRHDDSDEVRMAFKSNTEEIPGLPLVPIRRRPNVGDGRNGEGTSGEGDLEAKIGVSVERVEMIYHREVGMGLSFPVGADPFIDAGQIVKHLVGTVEAVLQISKKRMDILLGDP